MFILIGTNRYLIRDRGSSGPCPYILIFVLRSNTEQGMPPLDTQATRPYKPFMVCFTHLFKICFTNFCSLCPLGDSVPGARHAQHAEPLVHRHARTRLVGLPDRTGRTGTGQDCSAPPPSLFCANPVQDLWRG